MRDYGAGSGRPPCDVQALVTARFAKVVTVAAECSHFSDIWTSSRSNKSLFCARLAQQMHDVFLGDIEGLAICRHEKVLVAFDDWRWDICRLRNAPPSLVVISLARAVETCMSFGFRPNGPTLARPAVDRGTFSVGRDVLGALQGAEEDGPRLISAQRRFRKAIECAFAA